MATGRPFLRRFTRSLFRCGAGRRAPQVLLWGRDEWLDVGESKHVSHPEVQAYAPCLVVYVPEWVGSGSAKSLCALLRGELAQQLPQGRDLPLGPTDVLVFWQSRCPLTRESPYDLALELTAVVRKWVDLRAGLQPYEKVVLVGYSAGSLLIRKALAWGLDELQDFPRPGLAAQYRWDWAFPGGSHETKLDRLILIAGMNRGWSLQGQPKHMKLREYWSYRALVLLGRTRLVANLIMMLERGTPFVVDLRLQWLRLGARGVLPLTIQLLGGLEDLVSENDNLDAGVIGGFAVISVPKTRHYEMNLFKDTDDPEAGILRANLLREALAGDKAELLRRRGYQTPAKFANRRPPSAIVLIAHGIRSTADWSGRLKNALETRDRSLWVGHAGYGHLSILGFMIFPIRRRHVRWLADRLTERSLEALAVMAPSERDEAIASQAAATNVVPVHFIGHSNGTWLAAQLMKTYRAANFQRVALCESPVHRLFPWRRFHDDGRFTRLRNERAASDYAVGLAAYFFSEVAGFLRIPTDVGDGGRVGFQDPPQHGYIDTAYLPGGHSAGTEPGNDPYLIDYICGNDAPDAGRPLRPDRDILLHGFANAILIWGSAALLVLAYLAYLLASSAGPLTLAIVLLALLGLASRI